MKYILSLLLLLGCRSQSLPPNTITPDSNASNPPILIDAGEETVDVVEEPTPKHETILMIGDSQTGYIKTQIEKVRQPNETVFYNYRPGTTLLYWNRTISQVFSGCPFQHTCNYSGTINPTTILIFLGTCNYNFKFLQPIDNILNEIMTRKLKCVWSGPTRVYNDKHQINTLLKDKVSSMCSYVDVEELGIRLLGDETHPTTSGSEKWIRKVWQVKDEH